jgi:hypothetical protein
MSWLCSHEDNAYGILFVSSLRLGAVMAVWGRGSAAAVPRGYGRRSGPGVASPKSQLSGCEAGHAAFASSLVVLPAPSFASAVRRR